MGQKRDLRIDLLRIFACFMVVFLHVSGQNWSRVNVHSMEWLAFNVYDSAVRSCVPLFFMISGKLFLSRNQLMPLKQLFQKNIGKLLIIYFVWSFLYAVDRIGISHLTIETLFEETLASEFHLWYLPALIGVYLMLPVLWCIVHYEQGKYLKYTCIAVWGLGILRATFLALPFLPDIIRELLSTFSFDLGIYCGYFLMGYYIDNIKEKWQHIKTIYFIGVLIFVTAVGIILTQIYSLYNGEQVSFLYENQTFFPAVEAILILMIFLKIPIHQSMYRLQTKIVQVSHYTLFVYLFHPFVIEHLDNLLHINSLSFNAWFSVPILSIGITLFSMFMAHIFSKIHLIKHWI